VGALVGALDETVGALDVGAAVVGALVGALDDTVGALLDTVGALLDTVGEAEPISLWAQQLLVLPPAVNA